MEEFHQFIKKYRTKRFKKGELILVQGEVPECAHVIKSGIVKAYNLTLSGEEKPIGFDIESEIFPVSWTFKKVNHVQFYYEAFTESVVYCIPTTDIVKFLAENPKAQTWILDNLVSKYMHMQMRINALEQSKAPQKVINTIHYLCIRFGVEEKKNTVRIQLPLTQQDLANFIGLTRETTGIELKKLHQKGVLSYRRQNYVVRKDKLDDLLDEDYGLGIVFERAAAQLARQPKSKPRSN